MKISAPLISLRFGLQPDNGQTIPPQIAEEIDRMTTGIRPSRLTDPTKIAERQDAMDVLMAHFGSKQAAIGKQVAFKRTPSNRPQIMHVAGFSSSDGGVWISNRDDLLNAIHVSATKVSPLQQSDGTHSSEPEQETPQLRRFRPARPTGTIRTVAEAQFYKHTTTQDDLEW